MSELPSRYNPKETEDKWYIIWEENKLFSAKVNPAKKPFSIVIPPPNVTGILHMGHALNNTIQDILIRYHRMKGDEALWMPGTDHAGIATQNVVEKALAKEGLKRQDLGRERFIERVWQWKEQYGSTIIRQLKKLGASCDWTRARFTMDQEYSKAVAEVFVGLYEKGLIYKGSYIINWCPRCQTALSDEESPHREIEGNLYYIRYPLKEVSGLAGLRVNGSKLAHPHTGEPANFIVVATTRPETMLGDTAVAVNPKDRRYKKFIGKTLILPLVNREIKIIADDLVDAKFATGAVKVTPAHDPNDYLMGMRHNLDFIKVMHPDGRMNENAGDYRDMDRFEARQVVLEDLKEKGLLDKTEPHRHAVGHCYRCHTIIEPYLSKQWFVKMKPLAKPAIEAVKKGKIKFYPKRWTKVYINWMENIQDWCVSRQIWWGHRLPVYYCNDCYKEEGDWDQSAKIYKGEDRPHEKHPTLTIDEEISVRLYRAKGLIISRTKPDKCPDCGSLNFRQDEDVLDTWFSSWLWPFATFGWPNQGTGDRGQGTENQLNPEPRTLNPDLKYFYPTSTLVTAPEIIFFWVARMIMAGLEFMGDIPFKDVYIHGTVRDVEGKKMSKSLGNIIDPLDIINEYGTDALRFSLISITAQGQDVFLSPERFEQGRNFANKIWNASRFILMNLEPSCLNTDLCVFFKKKDLDLVNRWILSRFYSALSKTEKALTAYKFNEAANILYGFFWHEFCDWYLEIIKPDIKNKDNQVVMFKILEKFLRAIHPFMPFITEEIWQRLKQVTRSPGHQVTSIMIEPFPHIQRQIIDKKSEEKMSLIFELIVSIRNMRQELDIPPEQSLSAIIATEDKATGKLVSLHLWQIKHLSRLTNIDIQSAYTHPKHSISAIVKDMHISIPLEGVVDFEKEKARISARIKKTESEIISKEKMLANKEFIKKAPEDIVNKEKIKLKELKDASARLKNVKDGLS